MKCKVAPILQEMTATFPDLSKVFPLVQNFLSIIWDLIKTWPLQLQCRAAESETLEMGPEVLRQ